MRNDKLSKTEQMLQLFKHERMRPERSTTIFQVELRLIADEQQEQYMLAIELLVGSKKKLAVSHPIAFLEAIISEQFFAISKTIYYDPAEHFIVPAFREIALTLLQMNDLEPISNRSKTIPILPAWYFRIAHSLFTYAHTTLEYYLPDGPLDEQLQRYDRLIKEEGKLPLYITIKETNKHYVLSCDHIHELVLLPAYEAAIMRGKWYKLSFQHAKQLQFIQTLLLDNRDHEWNIESQYVGALLDVVLPKLKLICHIQIDASITTKLIQEPLQAKLFLDRVRSRLLVGLEFHYGSLSINPLLPESEQSQADHILLRDREKEEEILQLLDSVPSMQTEGGWIIEGDDDEYLFFHNVLPSLKVQTKVFATSAIKLRYVTEDVYPEISLNWDEKSNWLQYSFSMQGISDEELRHILQALKLKQKYYVLSDGAMLSLEQTNFQQLIVVMNELGLEHPTLFDDRIPIRRSIGYLQHISTNSPIKLSRSLRTFIEQIKQPSLYKVELPHGLHAQLRDYQIDGYQWLNLLADYELGGLLADEMGLGKTIQLIAFLLGKQQEMKDTGTKTLIVTPASLIYNWQHECEKFAPSLHAIVIEAHELSRGKQSKQLSEKLLNAQLWIISYQTLLQHLSYFTKHSFHTLVCDEAQMFKNDYTKTAKAVKLIAAKHRFALTGTPIENRLDELWSILHMLNPSAFSDKQQFLEWPKETLIARISPFLLRRTKSQVIGELPEKIESIASAPLLPEQRKLYLAYLAQLQEDTLKHLSPKVRGQTKIKLLAGITRLRQICCHPALFVDQYEGGSAKLDQLLQLVDDCYREGKRMLIFSQFTSMLSIIAEQLTMKGYQFFTLDGSTPPLQRIQNCEAFNNGERDLFLLSLKAGGTGLNLTGADTVILYDLWWNPAVEQQASDRVHRIGQKKVVNIIKLVSEGTLEDKMIQLQQRKQQLIDEVLQTPHDGSFDWDPEQILELLSTHAEEL